MNSKSKLQKTFFRIVKRFILVAAERREIELDETS